MKAKIDSLESIADTELSAIKVVIIYEDFASGTRARHFAERLAECLECRCPLSESLWRSDLLECPSIAAEAARAAAESDYLIVSLRGDRVVPFATRQWIDARLDGEDGRGLCVISLSDSNQGKWRVLEGNRHYFRTACAAKGVVFFSHMTTPSAEDTAPEMRDGEEAAGLDFSRRHRWPALLPA